MKSKVLTVVEINNIIKDILVNNIDGEIDVKGEISNLKYSGGHTYLTLKDDESSIHAVLWNGNINMKNGDSVIVTGKIGCYVKGGSYQITIKSIKKVGIGDLHIEYEKIKKEYEKKGYFNQKRKIKNDLCEVGILTSFEGAALYDILSVFNKNSFCGKVYIKNCVVQGEKCVQDVCDGIKYFVDNYPQLDLILITRGGGSFEDLIEFSDIHVLEAIYNSPVPTMSAIGHEIDFMLSDFVSDIRAPTPSVAGELISSYHIKNWDVIKYFKTESNKMFGKIEKKIQEYENKLDSFTDIVNMCSPINNIDNYLIKLNDVKNKSFDILINHINLYEQKLNNFIDTMAEQNINNLCKKGFVIITDMNGNIVSSKAEFKQNRKMKNKMNIYFNDGVYKL